MANDFQIAMNWRDLPPELWAYLKSIVFAMIVKGSTAGAGSPLVLVRGLQNCPASRDSGYHRRRSKALTFSHGELLQHTMVRKAEESLSAAAARGEAPALR